MYKVGLRGFEQNTERLGAVEYFAIEGDLQMALSSIQKSRFKDWPAVLMVSIEEMDLAQTANQVLA